jgi:hypothetical protein
MINGSRPNLWLAQNIFILHVPQQRRHEMAVQLARNFSSKELMHCLFMQVSSQVLSGEAESSPDDEHEKHPAR